MGKLHTKEHDDAVLAWPHYATLGELHSHGLGALAKRNPELLGKISKYGADAESKR